MTLVYEPALESLGDDFYDRVAAATFPVHYLRFRNDALLPLLGLDPKAVPDADFIAAFGRFESVRSFLALRYHGYQFGEYNPFLGDGRGFLYGQVRGIDGVLYDLGTKGSGTTPYSRGGDGRLTLKGGVREVLAAEMLHRLGVRTSRCLSLIETGEKLWRGDEPSPTRSSVMVRLSRSHIRFGSFERLAYLKRPDLVRRLLDHVISTYYSHLVGQADADAQFYSELVQRIAQLVAQWQAAGFCHGVLNTDNMSITGESFDYGPYAFIPTYDPGFTAAYFDYSGRYAYGHQAEICYWNLEMLQRPLALVIPPESLSEGLKLFADHYVSAYQQRMCDRLGFRDLPPQMAAALLDATLQFLYTSQVSYPGFFADLTRHFSPDWQHDMDLILQETTVLPNLTQFPKFCPWQRQYYQCLQLLAKPDIDRMGEKLRQANSLVDLLRPTIEAVWEPIVQADHWLPFEQLLDQIWA